MAGKTHTIEIDETTAVALQEKAHARGISVSKLVSELAAAPNLPSADEADVAELERRWKAVAAGQSTVAHADVVRWLEDWGKPAFRPWTER